ncbi:MAG TPA: hypothetical protein VNT23_06105 [Gaiellaceae bacterium]|nr:hypothetical protein [Gaiellaceae bacterium]
MWASRRRLGAAALIAGGLVWAAAWFLQALAGEEGTALGVGPDGWRAALFPALVLLPFGVWIFYVRLGSRAAGIGLAAAAVAELGLLALLAGNAIHVAGEEDAGRGVFLFGGFLALAGLLGLGVAVTRSGLLPRESGATFAGGLAAFVAGVLLLPLFGLGFLLWGYVLLGGTREEREA